MPSGAQGHLNLEVAVGFDTIVAGCITERDQLIGMARELWLLVIFDAVFAGLCGLLAALFLPVRQTQQRVSVLWLEFCRVWGDSLHEVDLDTFWIWLVIKARMYSDGNECEDLRAVELLPSGGHR
jgi:hypothetical protein